MFASGRSSQIRSAVMQRNLFCISRWTDVFKQWGHAHMWLESTDGSGYVLNRIGVAGDVECIEIAMMDGHFHVRNTSSRGIPCRSSRTGYVNSCQHRRDWKHHFGTGIVGAPLDIRYSATISKLPAHRN